MIVASFYSANDADQAGDFWRRERVRSFILSLAPLIEEFYLFVPQSDTFHELIQEHPPNVHIMCIGELFRGDLPRIDIWHDFGHARDRNRQHLGRLTGQDFHSTCDFRLEKLGDYIDLGRPSWSSYDAVIYPTEEARAIHVCIAPAVLGSLTSEVIVPGVDFGIVAPVSRSDARRLLGFPEHEVLYLCISDFDISEGTDPLPVIAAFGIAAFDKPDLRLVVATRRDRGDSLSRLACRLNNRVSARVSILANPHEQALPLLFAAADVFVHLPDSPLKLSPNFLLYAMSHKLAVITAQWLSSEFSVEHLKSGILLPLCSHPAIFEYIGEILRHVSSDSASLLLSQATAFDVETLANHMRSLADGPRRRDLGDAAFQQTCQHYSVSNTAKKYVALWRKLMDTPITNCYSENRTNDHAVGLKNLSLSCPLPSLDDERSLRLTTLGQKVLSGESVEIYDETSELIFGSLILGVLGAFKEAARVGVALDAFAPLYGDARQSAIRAGILYHILFCLKRGLLSDGGNPPCFR